MAVIADIILLDALGTPVSHTFSPARKDIDYAQWEDRSSPYFIGYNKISMGLKRPAASGKGSNSSAGRNIRAWIKLETPKLENVTNSTISGIAPSPSVSYRLTSTLEFVLPERCSLQDRKDIRKYVYNLMNNQFSIDLIETVVVAS